MAQELEPNESIRIYSEAEPWATRMNSGEFELWADEPEDEGGANSAPNPFQYLLAALGSCTSITVRMYAARKGWDLQSLVVDIDMFRRESDILFERRIQLFGNLDEEQRQRLLQVAKACPVAKIITGTVTIDSQLV